MANLRPIHQDDGWYASYAFRMLTKFNIFNNVSFFSYADTNGGNDNPAGFLFSLLQVPFYAIFGISILTVRIFNAILITFLLYFLQLIIKQIAPAFRWIIVVLFIVHPVFYYHFYNRPEILALLLSAISFYILLLAPNSKNLVFWAYFIWAFILDVHPIAIFTIIGIGLHYWIFNRKQTFFIIAGGFSGIFVYFCMNYFFNGTFGLFSVFFRGVNPNSFGDHYIPLFSSDFRDYFRIALGRFQTLKGSFLFSLIWIFLPLFFIRKCRAKKYVGLLIFNTISFWILAVFFTEAISNGFGLYSIFVFILFFIIILNELSKSYSFKPVINWIMVLPMLLFMSKSTTAMIIQNYKYYSRFNKDYSQIKSFIPDRSKVLMRPTFAFNMGLKGLHSDYTFGILNVMIEKSLSFEEAIRIKGYDYILLDNRNLQEELLIDKRDNNKFDNPAYKKYLHTGLTSLQFDTLLQKGFLIQVCSFEEISHGKTIFYKVNR